MTRKHLVVALLLLGHGYVASAQQTPSAGSAPAPAPISATAQVSGENYGYVGAATRIGLGYDETTHLRGELYRVLNESPTSSLLGEAWISKNAGGLKISYNWLPERWSASSLKSADPTVRKFFVAADRNTEGDAKVTVGGGFERSNLFGGLYGAFGVTGRRQILDTSVSTLQTIQGNDGGRAFIQDITTTVRSRVFERPYDYGVGARIGFFHDPSLIRATVGADYEWGRDSARQTTLSVGVEKYFAGAPYSVALNMEHYRKSGGFDLSGSDSRVMAMFRYEFGGGSAFRPNREVRMVEVATKPAVLPPAPAAPVATPAVVASAPTPAPTQAPPAAQPTTRKETRLVKTTASMSADAFFEFDKSVLTPVARTALDGVIARIKASGFVGNLHLTGHTCDIGPAAYNQRLSERRATAVRNYLIANGALSRDVIVTEGKGEANPRYPNTRAERYKNRRVDLEFVTYEDKAEEFVVTVPAAAAPAPAPTPRPAPIATPAIVPAPVAAQPAPPAAVEWRREVIETEPTWMRRALRQSLPHKHTVDVYRQLERSATVTSGEKRYLNRPPVAVNDSYSITFNSTANLLPVLENDSDPDGDGVTVTSVSPPQHGTATIAGSRIVYTPTAGYAGGDTFTYTVSDGKGGTASATVSIVVQGLPNRPPIAQNDTYSVEQGSTTNSLNVLANDSDPDGDSLTISAVSNPAHGTATTAGNRINYTPAAGYTGADTFTYSITDGRGGNATATVSITVTPIAPANRPPVALNDAFTVNQDSAGNSLNVLANDSDPDGDVVTIVSVSTPGHGTATIAGNRISYTPTSGYAGGDSFTYTISDGRGGSATATVSITVTPTAPANRPPVAQNDTYSVEQNSTSNLLNVLLNDSDPDGDSLTIATVSAPAHGTASISGNRISYTPTAGYSGADTFTYTISDGRGGSATATVSITVTATGPGANRPPVAQPDAFSVDQNSTANSLNVLVNDSDPDGDALSLATVGTPANGIATISGNRVLYTPTAGFVGTDAFNYSISDGRGGTASATITITVRAVANANRPPLAVDDAFFVSQRFTELNVLANDSDPDGDALTIISVTQPFLGIVEIISGGKSLRYTMVTGFNRTVFTYTISDGRGGTSTATVTLTDP